nr:MAG: internal scaffolding protein [Microvirus Sku119]
MVFRKLYDYDRFEGTTNNEPSLTDSSQEENTNVVKIVKQLGIGKFEDAINWAVQQGTTWRFGDDSDMITSLQAQDMKAVLYRKWNRLSDEAKAKFKTVANFYKFASDPASYNDNEFRKLVKIKEMEIEQSKLDKVVDSGTTEPTKS